VDAADSGGVAPTAVWRVGGGFDGGAASAPAQPELSAPVLSGGGAGSRGDRACSCCIKFPKIEKLAEKIGADIGFEDEAGVGIMTRAGRTWGEVGAPPVVPATDRRGGYNVLSVITATGTLRYSIEAHSIDSERYLAFSSAGAAGANPALDPPGG